MGLNLKTKILTSNKRIALKIALIYVAIGSTWILFSDQFLGALVTNYEAFVQVGILKGWLFVIATGGVIYLLITRAFASQQTFEKALLESEAIIRSILTAAVDAIITINEHGMIEAANPATERLFGYTSEEMIGRNVSMLMPLPYRDEHNGYIRLYLDTGRKKIIGIGREVLGQRKDGTIFPMHLAVSEVLVGKRRLFTGIVHDITELKQATERLAEEKERLAVTLRSIGDGVITTDIGARVVLINKMAERLTGWKQEEAAGKAITEIFNITDEKEAEPASNLVEKVLRFNEPLELESEITLTARDGKKRLIHQSCAPIHDQESKIVGAVLVFRDVTERKIFEAELQRAQKLETIGTLAGGIAHDFNNYLHVILSNINLAKMDLPAGHENFEALTEAEKACTWAKDLTQQLITFSKGGAPIKKITALAGLLKEVARFSLSGSKAKCKLSIPDDLWIVEVDDGQIKQAISNLLINADQAMPEGGMIQLHAENLTMDSGDGLPLANGKFVKITIQDQGIGIAPEHLPKIFDPFFTTKATGSGLGLASAYSIIKKHDGYITVESKVGAGATFCVYLPASTGSVMAAAKPSTKIERGQGRILLMDDNDSLRLAAGKILKRLGFEVEMARDGSETIALYKNAMAGNKRFDAVMLDITVAGGMGGREAIQQLRQIDSDVIAIACSGYSKDPIIANFSEYGFDSAIVKPYTSKELSEILNHAVKKRSGV
jgi:PAS domain S-box-containing protein